MTNALLKTKHDKLFDLLDCDGSGTIEGADVDHALDRAEFAALMAGFGQPGESASVAFDRLADNGFITREVHYDAWKTYVSSDDDSAGANAMMA